MAAVTGFLAGRSRLSWRDLRARGRKLLGAAAAAAGSALRVAKPAAHGYLGAAAISVGAGEFASHVFHHGLAPWLTLLVAGLFSMWFGAELNRNAPPAAG